MRGSRECEWGGDCAACVGKRCAIEEGYQLEKRKKDRWKILAAIKVPRVSLLFAWYDLWIGAYIDSNSRFIYVCLIPTIAVRIFYGSSLREVAR